MVEIDAGDSGEKLRQLEFLLGPATVVVLSGGVWTDPATGEAHPKRHVYWRLSEATDDQAEHDLLAVALSHAAILVDADRSAISPVHPLRWPGSVHRKDPAHPIACRIERINEQAEVHLEEANEKLSAAVNAFGLTDSRGGDQNQWAGEQPPASLSDLASALDAIPVEGMSHDQWIIIGMALHNATDGSDAGLDLFDRFSRRSSEYDRRGLEAQWRSFANKPPGRRLRTPGTVYYLARLHGWQFPTDDQSAAGEPPRDEDDLSGCPIDLVATAAGSTEEEPRTDGQQGRGERPRPEGPLVLPPPSNPMAVARVFIAQHCTQQDTLTLRYWCGSWWAWRTTHWVEVEERTVRSLLYHFTDKALYRDARKRLLPWAPTRRRIGDLMEALGACIILPDHLIQPCWFDDRPSGQIVAVRNGLLNITKYEFLRSVADAETRLD
jgi:hypothetical protein